MHKPKILIICSNYYKELAQLQLNSCTKLLDEANYPYQVEILKAGAYEIPAVIRFYHKYQAFEGYIPLGLILKGTTDHYEFIWQHLKECFIQFAMQGIIIGNGVISAQSMKILRSRVENTERVKEAFLAVDYLISLQRKLHASRDTTQLNEKKDLV